MPPHPMKMNREVRGDTPRESLARALILRKRTGKSSCPCCSNVYHDRSGVSDAKAHMYVTVGCGGG